MHKTILVTGGAGFIGSHFIRLMLDRHPTYQIINADSLTYAANPTNLADAAKSSRYTFVKADIRDRVAVGKLFDDYDIDSVVNFAAQSHVDRSIDDPEAFITTNVLGVQVLLDAAVRKWKIIPEDKNDRQFKSGVKFVQISTDEVYGAVSEGASKEEDPLLPNNPYAASKAGADLLVRSYHRTYGLPVNITRCCNNYGPGQHPEKLIPLAIKNLLRNEPVPIYGDGAQVRSWLHVRDHCSAVDAVLHDGTDGEIYNVGTRDERTNMAVIRLLISRMGLSEKLITHVKDRPGHDRRYAVDCRKISAQLGWQPTITFENGLEETLKWYVKQNTAGMSGRDENDGR